MTDNNQNNLASKIWSMCNVFRGSIDASKYKDYILILLFIYYLDIINSKNDKDEYHKLFGKQTFNLRSNLFEYWQDKSGEPNFSEILQNEINLIEKRNPIFEGIFESVDFNSNILGSTKDRNNILSDLFNKFKNLKVDVNSDFIGDAYQILIEKFAGASGKSGGEFYTPSQVSVLLSKILNPQNKEKIYDPTCGSGSLLLKVKKENPNVSLYGQEKSRQTFGLCKMNLILNNDEQDIENIKNGNTLSNPLHKEHGQLLKFDKIIANPPYSASLNGDFEKIINDQRFLKYGLTNKGKIDYLFLEHMIASLKPNGKIVTLMPLGVLERVGKEYNIRQKITDSNLIEAIITLPNNLFYGTTIPVCVYIIKNNKENDQTIFIDATKEFAKSKDKNTLTNENIKNILNAYQNFKDIEEFSKVVSLKEIQKKAYSLSPKKYITYKQEKIKLNLNENQEQIKSYESEITNLESQVQELFKQLKNANE